jgi:hypothetical protein
MYSGSSTTTRKQSRHSLDPGLSDACTIRARRSCNLASVIIPPTCSQTCVFSRANNAAQQIGGESSIFGSRSDRRRSSPGPLGEGERYGGLTGTVDAPSRRTPRSGPQNGPIGSDGRNRRFRGGHAQGVRAPMRMIAAITIRPNATDARTVTKLAVELMSFLRGIW